MEISLSGEDLEFQKRARDWLALNVPKMPRPLRGPGARSYDLEWQSRKHTAGFGAISWPLEYGGAGLTALQQMLWYEECAKVDAPGVGCLSIALGHAGPTIMAHGTPEQKARYLPSILRGEVVWCQGFSEPNAGSDLASLRTRAAIVGDELVINGSKIWTSHAHLADFQEMLVRTDPEASKHAGISWIICDMKSPGITIRPIDTIAGDQHYCEVFYDDVRVPLANLVGRLNEGWRVAQATLTSERSAAAASRSSGLSRLVERLIDMARTRTGLHGRALICDERIAERLATHRAEAAALRALTYVSLSRAARNSETGATAALQFLYFGELLQRVRETGVELLGADALILSAETEDLVRGFLMDRMHVIAGGTAEVRRNIVAQHFLGLPRVH